MILLCGLKSILVARAGRERLNRYIELIDLKEIKRMMVPSLVQVQEKMMGKENNNKMERERKESI